MTSKPSATNCPNTFILAVRSVAPSVPVWHGQDIRRGLCGFRIYGHLLVPCHPHVPLPSWGYAGHATLKSGGYCGRVPPLPIPNREVKPARADGTAMQCGRVGHRLLYCLPGASGHPGRLFLLLKVANNQKKSYVCNRKMARGFHFGASRPGYLHNLSVKTACGD